MSKLIARPPRLPAAADALDAFVSAAPDSGVSMPAPQAAAAPAAPAPDEKLPRQVRKRKEAITVTVDPGLLHRFDLLAQEMGLSRASAIGLAMHRFIEAERG